MQNEVPKDNRPLFAQGAIYDATPPLDYGYAGHPYPPNYSPNCHQDYRQSPVSSPRFSTPDHFHSPRPPKYCKGGSRHGSPAGSPWRPHDASTPGSSRFSGSPNFRSAHQQQQRRFSGSQGASPGRSWNSSGQSWNSSLSHGNSGIQRYVKPSMVEDPWAELERQMKRTDATKSQEEEPTPQPDCEEGRTCNSAEVL